jgi:hypothetical protein
MTEENSTFAETLQSALSDYTKSLIATIILPPIVDFLKEEKDVDVSIEELEQALNVQANALVAPIIRSGARRKKKPRKEVSVEKPKDGEGCIYLYVRGRKGGKYCNQDCAEDSLFCKEHKSSSVTKNAKKIAQAKTKKEKVKKDTKKDDVGIKTEVPKINVSIFKIKNNIVPGYYSQNETGFILHETPDSIYAVCKEEEDKSLRLLTKEEQKEAKKYDLNIFETKKEATKALEELKKVIESMSQEEEETEEKIEDKVEEGNTEISKKGNKEDEEGEDDNINEDDEEGEDDNINEDDEEKTEEEEPIQEIQVKSAPKITKTQKKTIQPKLTSSTQNRGKTQNKIQTKTQNKTSQPKSDFDPSISEIPEL